MGASEGRVRPRVDGAIARMFFLQLMAAILTAPGTSANYFLPWSPPNCGDVYAAR